MASKYIKDTVWAYLQANWVETRLLEVENLFNATEASEDPLTEWVTFMDENAVETQASVGAPGNQRWREEGILVFIAFVPSGTGTDRALTLAEALRDMFRELMTNDGAGGETIIFRQVDPPDTVLPNTVEASSGNWFGYGVAATYYCDFCRAT